MPRQRRLHVRGGLYHAMLRGNHRQPIFGGRVDYLRFEAILAEALDRYGASLVAYCWMPNHVHLAVQVANAPLGDLMRVLASRYARQLQRPIPTTGHLFERRYRARLVDADRYLLALVRYIHLNPVRARMVADPRDYPWSSHRAYLGGARPDWLRVDAVLAVFGAPAATARLAYGRYLGEAPDASEQDQVVVTARCSAPGSGKRHSPTPATGAGPGPSTTDRAAGPRSLDAITAEVAIEYGVAVEALASRRRLGPLVRARTEIARRALREGAANLTEVARHLGRSPSTLSDLLLRLR